MILKALPILLLALSCQVQADSIFFEAGLAFHDENFSCPEFCNGTNYLGVGGFGYRRDLAKSLVWETSLQHDSGLNVWEVGGGFNKLDSRIRYDIELPW